MDDDDELFDDEETVAAMESPNWADWLNVLLMPLRGLISGFYNASENASGLLKNYSEHIDDKEAFARDARASIESLGGD